MTMEHRHFQLKQDIFIHGPRSIVILVSWEGNFMLGIQFNKAMPTTEDRGR